MPPKKNRSQSGPVAKRPPAKVPPIDTAPAAGKAGARRPPSDAGRPAATVRAALPATPVLLADDAAFAEALEALSRLDATFMRTIRDAGELPRLRRREPGFSGLAQIIVSQQVSTASANAIFGRLQARFPALGAPDILVASDDHLRSCGLSAPKIRALRAIAEAVRDGHLDFAELARAEAEAAHASLCTIKGVGPWTADIFLLFCLGHGDAWPVGDLALQEGARLALGLADRPDAKALLAIGERWRPLRGVVAHCLWAHYSHRRARPATPQSTSTATASGTIAQIGRKVGRSSLKSPANATSAGKFLASKSAAGKSTTVRPAPRTRTPATMTKPKGKP